MRALKSSTAMDSRGIVGPFPGHTGFKGILRRIVQLLKRHRDIYFENLIKSAPSHLSNPDDIGCPGVRSTASANTCSTASST